MSNLNGRAYFENFRFLVYSDCIALLSWVLNMNKQIGTEGIVVNQGNFVRIA